MALKRNVIYRLEPGGPDLDSLLQLVQEAHGTPSVAALSPWVFVIVEPPFEAVFFRNVREVATPFELDVAALASQAAYLVVVLVEQNSPRAEESAFAAASALYEAARREGFGSIWYQPLESRLVLERINAPKWYRLAAIIAIGEPAEPAAEYQGKPLSTVVVIHRAGENRVLKDEGSRG